MVKAEVQTPNKRKSLVAQGSAKKVKLENENIEKTPKPFTPKKKVNQQESTQKSNQKNKQIKTETVSPKKVVPFAGTKQLNNKPKQKQNKKSVKPENGASTQSATAVAKKKRRNQFAGLITSVKDKEGTKDPEIISKINEKIEAIQSRPDLSKTARRKLALFQKLKLIAEEGQAAAAEKTKKINAKAKAEQVKEKAKLAGNKGPVKPKIQKADEESDESNENLGNGKSKQTAKKNLVTRVKKSAEAEDSDESNEDVDDEEDEDAESGEEEEDSDAEGGEDDEEGDDDDDEDDSDEESEDEVPAPQKKQAEKKIAKGKNKDNASAEINLNDLEKSNLVKKGQKRFVLFVGNIPYDTTKQDLIVHFSKAGEVFDVRLPTQKGTNKPRGFGYIEVKNEITYQKCLSMHHSQLKGRQINVLYTQGGKKKGEVQKKEIKAKNMKLHALRKQGKLAGSTKSTQKRSFRRNKGKANREAGDS